MMCSKCNKVETGFALENAICLSCEDAGIDCIYKRVYTDDGKYYSIAAIDATTYKPQIGDASGLSQYWL
jgi:hypothetical protein